MRELNLSESKINYWIKGMNGQVTKEDILQEVYLIQLEADSGLNQFNTIHEEDAIHEYLYKSISKRILGYDRTLLKVKESSFDDLIESGSVDEFLDNHIDSIDNTESENAVLNDALSQLDIMLNSDYVSFYRLFGIDTEKLDRKETIKLSKQFQRLQERAINNLITNTALEQGLSLEQLEKLMAEQNFSQPALKKHKKDQRHSGVKELA